MKTSRGLKRSGQGERGVKKVGESIRDVPSYFSALHESSGVPIRPATTAAWAAWVIVIGQLLIEAYKASQDTKAPSDVAGALAAINTSLQNISRQLDQIRVDQQHILEELAKVSVKLQALSAQILKVNFDSGLSTAETGAQNLRTYLVDVATAKSRIALLDQALVDLQAGANLILRNDPDGLATQLFAAGIVMVWRPSFDATEAVHHELDANYKILDASRHEFYRDYVDKVKSFFNRCSVLKPKVDAWLNNTVVPQVYSKAWVFDDSKGEFKPSLQTYKQEYPGKIYSGKQFSGLFAFPPSSSAFCSTYWVGTGGGGSLDGVWRWAPVDRTNPDFQDRALVGRAEDRLKQLRLEYAEYKYTQDQLADAANVRTLIDQALQKV